MTQIIYQLARESGEHLLKRGWKLATAESCTGGGLGYFITEIPGSSGWLERGFITYSNEAKQTLLDVKITTLDDHGAVSQAVACEMAEGALAHSQAQVSIAITGIAGPDGGSIEKPVGTVWFAWAGVDLETVSEARCFAGDRHAIRLQAIQFALENLLRFIQ